MRLREMEVELTEIFDTFSWSIADVPNTSTSRVTSPKSINKAINKIKKYGFIDNELDKLKKSYLVIYENRDDTITVQKHIAEGYRRILEAIVSKVSAVLDAISYSLEEQKENMISVKLPPYTDLKKVSRFINDIDNFVRTVLPPNQQTEIKLNNFDTGSNWIELVLSTSRDIIIIGEFIKYTTIFSKKYLSGSIKNEKEIEQSDVLKDEVRSVMLQGLKDLREQNAKLCVTDLLQNGKIDVTEIGELQEYKNGLVIQMLKMGSYIVEGAEVRPALNAPEEVKEEFPQVEEYKQIQSSVTQLLIEHLKEVSADSVEEETNEE